MASGRLRIVLFLVPATLTSQGSDRLDTSRYAPWRSGKERLTGEALLSALPEIGAIADVEVDAGNPHEAASLGDLKLLAERLEATLARTDVDGAVIVHGTNSLEETAFFLDLTIVSEKPVALTGAQRPFTALSSDGPMNLVSAIRVAASPMARGLGVLVVVNDEIHAARDVTKTNTYRVHTFRSRETGVLGIVDADAVCFQRRPFRAHEASFRLRDILNFPRVEILYVHVGSRGDIVGATLALGIEGLVIAGSGAGATGDLRDALRAVAQEGRAAVVRSSRVGEGRVLRDDNWQEPGMIAAGNLNPHKSALLLSLALTRTRDPAAIQAMFDAA